jgi:hypothetical protein
MKSAMFRPQRFFLYLKTNQKMKNKKLKMFIGFILLPIFVSVYFCDRFILVFLPHLDGFNIKKWFQNTKQMGMSTIRVSALTIIYFIYLLLQYRING